jgi:hypothetical protein
MIIPLHCCAGGGLVSECRNHRIKSPDKHALKNLDGLSELHKSEKDCGREVKFF